MPKTPCKYQQVYKTPIGSVLSLADQEEQRVPQRILPKKYPNHEDGMSWLAYNLLNGKERVETTFHQFLKTRVNFYRALDRKDFYELFIRPRKRVVKLKEVKVETPFQIRQATSLPMEWDNMKPYLNYGFETLKERYWSLFTGLDKTPFKFASLRLIFIRVRSFKNIMTLMLPYSNPMSHSIALKLHDSTISWNYMDPFYPTLIQHLCPVKNPEVFSPRPLNNLTVREHSITLSVQPPPGVKIREVQQHCFGNYEVYDSSIRDFISNDTYGNDRIAIPRVIRKMFSGPLQKGWDISDDYNDPVEEWDEPEC